MLSAKQTKRDPSVNGCLTEGSHGGKPALKFRCHTSGSALQVMFFLESTNMNAIYIQ
jgi:hypothetical protein